MKPLISLPRASLGRPLPTVAAYLRGELPQALQGPVHGAKLLQREAIAPGLLDDLCAERPDDCRFWDVLRAPEARVVATGQQPGVLGGSLLVLYKAATAVALARSLEKEHHIPVVPVFWNATDDVDFDEIASIGWHTQRDGLFYLQLPRRDWSAESFIGDLPAPGDQAALLALQSRVSSQAAERLQQFASGSAPDHGDWVAQMLRRIFPQLLVLDARSPALRRHAAPLFESYLKQLPAARETVEAQIAALQKLGHQRVLAPASIAMGLFLTEGNRRQKTNDAAILLQQVRDNPAGLSPNVTLRPLVQQWQQFSARPNLPTIWSCSRCADCCMCQSRLWCQDSAAPSCRSPCGRNCNATTSMSRPGFASRRMPYNRRGARKQQRLSNRRRLSGTTLTAACNSCGSLALTNQYGSALVRPCSPCANGSRGTSSSHTRRSSLPKRQV